MTSLGHRWKQKKPRSMEWRIRHSKLMTGRKLSEETKRKISLSSRRPCSPEKARKIGMAQLGEKNHNWKGGRYKNQKGYVLIKARDHPNANNRGYILEHRFIMECEIGRLLEKHEEVHHVNLKRDDNRPENLMLFEDHSKHEDWHRENNIPMEHKGR